MRRARGRRRHRRASTSRAAEQPDVVLLDVMMPGLDGWRVAEELLEDDRTNGIPIIFLTARAEFRDRARGLDIGGVDYVTKPFNPLELAPLVRDLLARIERGERDELRGEKLAELRSLDRVRASAGLTLGPRGVAQPGRAPGLGPGGRQFESAHPDSRNPTAQPRSQTTRARRDPARAFAPSERSDRTTTRGLRRSVLPATGGRSSSARSRSSWTTTGRCSPRRSRTATFFAIPSVLLVAVGVFTLVAGPDTISTLMAHFSARHAGAGDEPARQQPPAARPQPVDERRHDRRRRRARALVDDRRDDDRT